VLLAIMPESNLGLEPINGRLFFPALDLVGFPCCTRVGSEDERSVLAVDCEGGSRVVRFGRKSQLGSGGFFFFSLAFKNRPALESAYEGSKKGEAYTKFCL
jgi:hypothetical protein